MSVKARRGDIVAAYPGGSCRAIARVLEVKDAGGGDLLLTGNWFFEDGRMESLEVYAGMCYESDKDELKEAEKTYQNSNKL